MNVYRIGEGFDQTRIICKVGDATKFDLVVIGNHEQVAIGRHKCCAKDLSFIRTDWDVVQVWLIATEPSSSGNHLVEGCMNSSVFSHRLKQALAIG